MEGKISISDAELEIVEVLWRVGMPISALEIRKQLEQVKQWERTTVLTLIQRLVKKGVLHQEKREIYYYSVNIKKEDYVKGETKQFLNKLYQGNAKNLVAMLFQEEGLTKEDLEELRTYLNKEEENG